MLYKIQVEFLGMSFDVELSYPGHSACEDQAYMDLIYQGIMHFLFVHTKEVAERIENVYFFFGDPLFSVCVPEIDPDWEMIGISMRELWEAVGKRPRLLKRN